MFLFSKYFWDWSKKKYLVIVSILCHVLIKTCIPHLFKVLKLVLHFYNVFRYLSKLLYKLIFLWFLLNIAQKLFFGDKKSEEVLSSGSIVSHRMSFHVINCTIEWKNLLDWVIQKNLSFSFVSFLEPKKGNSFFFLLYSS